MNDKPIVVDPAGGTPINMDDIIELITITEASKMLGCSTTTLRSYERRGLIVSVRPFPTAPRKFHKQDIIKLAQRRK